MPLKVLLIVVHVVSLLLLLRFMALLVLIKTRMVVTLLYILQSKNIHMHISIHKSHCDIFSRNFNESQRHTSTSAGLRQQSLKDAETGRYVIEEGVQST